MAICVVIKMFCYWSRISNRLFIFKSELGFMPKAPIGKRDAGVSVVGKKTDTLGVSGR